jgi:hypothetical protein
MTNWPPNSYTEGSLNMVRMLLGGLLFGLLLTGAYAARYTPEVLNCDRRRQSVVVRVDDAYPSDAGVVRREVGSCNLWFHGPVLSPDD